MTTETRPAITGFLCDRTYVNEDGFSRKCTAQAHWSVEGRTTYWRGARKLSRPSTARFCDRHVPAKGAVAL